MGQFLKSILSAILLVTGAASATTAQKAQDFIPQFHSYATQAFIYNNNKNSWNATNATGASGAWTEGVVNLTGNPTSRLSLGAQTRYFRLGTYGHKVMLDWASAEFKLSSRYNVSPMYYLKLEPHFLDRTATGFSTSNNPHGLAETSRLTLAKLWVTF